MSRVDLKKQSLRKTFVTLHGTLPINEHMTKCVREMELWFDTKLYMTGSGLTPGWEVFGFGEKPKPWSPDEEAEDEDDDDES